MLKRKLCTAGFVIGLTGCAGAPRSQLPDAESALQRMRSALSCSRGVQIKAKADYFGANHRVRGDLSVISAMPESVRIDVYTPLGLILSTLTSDGERFSLYDLQSRQYWWGSASACNLARFTKVSVPPFVLAQLLRGEAPVLKHDPAQATVRWSSSWLGTGHYVLDIAGNHRATERIEMVPASDDWSLPWERQRLHVTSVTVWQAGQKLYEVMLDGHEPAQTAGPREDPDGLEPPVMPSGPACNADVPRRIRFLSSSGDTDFVLSYSQVVHNPPLIPNVFQQPVPGGVRAIQSECSD